ncbi:MAG: hypothetical protein ACWA5P_02850 [bacterium]
MTNRKELISTDNIEKLLNGFNHLFLDETILVDEQEKDGVTYQIQVKVTRDEDEFIDN